LQMRALRRLLLPFTSRVQMKSMPTPPATLDEMDARRACVAFFLLRTCCWRGRQASRALPVPRVLNLVGVGRCQRKRSPLLLRGGAVGRDAFDERAPLSSQRPQEPMTRIFRHDDAARRIADQETRGRCSRTGCRNARSCCLCCAALPTGGRHAFVARLGGSQHASARFRPPGRTIDCAC
jgi:hypothetical protein